MTAAELERYIFDRFGVTPDHPWASSPEYAVYRHSANRKWFALVMTLPRERLGLQGGGFIDVVNLKCDPLLIGSMRCESGFFPAYHMNRENWLTAAIDGSADDEKLRLLAEMSFDLTAPKPKKAK